MDDSAAILTYRFDLLGGGVVRQHGLELRLVYEDHTGLQGFRELLVKR